MTNVEGGMLNDCAKRNDECGMLNVEWSAEPMKNVECGMWNVEWSAEPMKNEE